jgi:hypothetical protein
MHLQARSVERTRHTRGGCALRRNSASTRTVIRSHLSRTFFNLAAMLFDI